MLLGYNFVLHGMLNEHYPPLRAFSNQEQPSVIGAMLLMYVQFTFPSHETVVFGEGQKKQNNNKMFSQPFGRWNTLTASLIIQSYVYRAFFDIIKLKQKRVNVQTS